MHKYERIALWTLVVVTLIIVVFKPSVSGWTGQPSSILDSSDLDAFPPQIADAIRRNGKAIIKAVGDKSRKDWNAMSSNDKLAIIKSMDISTKMGLDQLKNTNGILGKIMPSAKVAPPMLPVPVPISESVMPAPAMSPAQSIFKIPQREEAVFAKPMLPPPAPFSALQDAVMKPVAVAQAQDYIPTYMKDQGTVSKVYNAQADFAKPVYALQDQGTKYAAQQAAQQAAKQAATTGASRYF